MKKVERVSQEIERIEKHTVYLENKVIEIETNAKVMIDIIPKSKNIN